MTAVDVLAICPVPGASPIGVSSRNASARSSRNSGFDSIRARSDRWPARQCEYATCVRFVSWNQNVVGGFADQYGAQALEPNCRGGVSRSKLGG